MKKVAITGSSGYVGSCLKNHFSLRGWDVLELTRRPLPVSKGVQFTLGQHIAAESLAGVQVLVHCAYDMKLLRWSEICALNVEGTRKLFRAAREAGVQKIVCISSISAYEGCRSLYGKAKLEIEKVALEHEAMVVRPGLVYGPGPGGMFGKLYEQVRKSKILPLIGDGSQIQFLVHEQDLSHWIERWAAEDPVAAARVLTLANPQPWPFKKLLVKIARVQGRKLMFLPLPWRLVWAGLRAAELCGLKLNFRSDSLVSLIYQNPAPDFSGNVEAGLVCRPFDISNLNYRIEIQPSHTQVKAV